MLYSAHSIPMSYVKKGDPYPEQIKKHIELINKKAGVKSYSLSYQSKVGPVKWLAPSTYETLEQYAIDKKDNIIVVPISFITDHIETLIELDEQLIPIIKDKGLNIVRSRSLNDSDDFIKAFTEILKAS